MNDCTSRQLIRLGKAVFQIGAMLSGLGRNHCVAGVDCNLLPGLLRF